MSVKNGLGAEFPRITQSDAHLSRFFAALFVLFSFSAVTIRTEEPLGTEVISLPTFRVEATAPSVPWRYAICDGFELLSDLSDGRMELFATEFGTFLAFLQKVCPELLLPEGTKLSIVLASPRRFADLVPLAASPIGYAQRPWGVIARSQDTAVMVMRYDGRPEPTTYVGPDGVVRLRLPMRDAAARDTLIHAQATYLTDPAMISHRRVVHTGTAPDLPFVDAIGESRPFLDLQQPFIKSGLLAVLAGMSSAVGREYSFHDQQRRWEQYFPETPAGTQELWRVRLPIRTLPSLNHFFGADIDSPMWSSPLHRLTRDAFVHWALLGNGPDQARSFLDLLARSGPEPISETQFTEVFGENFSGVTRRLMEYINPRGSDRATGLPSRNFWNRLPHEFTDIERTFSSRPATPEESSRVRADFYRMVGNHEAAERALSPRFRANQLDDHIWITSGLIMLEHRKVAEALRCFSSAIQLETRRPLAYIESARILFRIAEARGGDEGGKFGMAELRPIYSLLAAAAERPPALRETTALLAAVIQRQNGIPDAEWLALLEASAATWRYDPGLIARAATVLAEKGQHDPAIRLLATARQGTLDVDVLAGLTLLETRLSQQPTESRLVSDTPATAGEISQSVAHERGEQDFAIPELDVQMVRIAAGTFQMGGMTGDPYFRNNQGPTTTVTVSRGFWMAATEVTQAQWETVMGSTVEQLMQIESPDLRINGIGGTLPIYHVSWFEAVEFCERLTSREKSAGRIRSNQEYRLPTEAEWEFACRAGTDGPFFDTPSEVAWLPNNLPPRWIIPFNTVTNVPVVNPVGRKRPNQWGLYDMYGNVSEWCLDWYAPSLPGGRSVDPIGPITGAYKVVRGGSSWALEAGVPTMGSAVRSRELPAARFARGFRPVLAEARP